MGTERRLVFDYQLHADQQLPSAVFMDLALERGLPELAIDGWATSQPAVDELGTPLLRMKSGRHEAVLVERDGVLLSVGVTRTHIQVTAAAESRDRIEQTLAELRELYPTPDPSSAHEVPVTFWTYGPQGPQPSYRPIAVPSWDDVQENYAGATAEHLRRLMREFQPAHGGQLVLWHGEAGTGKTFALRALAWEWRDWCQVHYVVDPDALFGAHADYLMSVLLQEGGHMFVGSHAFHSFGQFVFAADGEEESEEDAERELPWRVLVLEDTGELLAADARVAAGQGLSRFLNVVDGLIGQGLRVLVLVTTNEELKKLHPAVARPGRCAANVEFVSLEADEAKAWLERHGSESRPTGRRTLASLYAEIEGRDPTELTLVGFGG